MASGIALFSGGDASRSTNYEHRVGKTDLLFTGMEGTEAMPPSVTFTDRMTINLGSLTVELIYPGVSHTDDSIMVVFRKLIST